MVRPKGTPPTAPEPEKVTVHPVVEADSLKGRVAARLSIQYFLRSAQLVSNSADGDLMNGMIMYAIVAGNVGYLDTDPRKSGEFASIEHIAPDSVRRPISVLAVAQSLGIPFENTRRRVNKLIRAGKCQRVKGGVIVPAAALSTPSEDADALANMGNLRRFLRELRRAGVVGE